MPKDIIQKIESAKVYDVAIRSSIDFMPSLSRQLNNQIFLKREDEQEIFSFKLRGAYNKISNLRQNAQGVITASAGNHAQGVALAAKKLGIPATIVMPRNTPSIKVHAVRRYRPKVILHGELYNQTATYAKQLAIKNDLVYISPYDDVDVIVGQGTVGKEIHQQCSTTLDTVFVPVGGGGLLAGIAVYLHRVRPHLKIIAVEPENAACLQAAMKQGRRVTLPKVGAFADGTAIAQVGKAPYQLLKKMYGDHLQVITVSDDQICTAIKDIFADTRSIAEPAGALALAGMKQYIEKTRCKNKELLAILSGANINFDRLGYIAERVLAGEKREVMLCVTIPEQPGSFKSLCKIIGNRNITEFNYRYRDSQKAQVLVGIVIDHKEKEKMTLLQSLRKAGYPAHDWTDNSIATVHIRHMIGGRVRPPLMDEKIYSVVFPETPGALLRFLKLLPQGMNITMFHYRSHGSAFGEVLVGIQFNGTRPTTIISNINDAGFLCHEETDNMACHFFL